MKYMIAIVDMRRQIAAAQGLERAPGTPSEGKPVDQCGNKVATMTEKYTANEEKYFAVKMCDNSCRKVRSMPHGGPVDQQVAPNCRALEEGIWRPICSPGSPRPTLT